jgi:hypothetical protein
MAPRDGTHAPQAFRGFARLFAWLEHPQAPNAVFFTLGLICALLGALDFVRERHATYPFEQVKVFYGFLGFVVCIFIVQAARLLRLLVKRDERYYD